MELKKVVGKVLDTGPIKNLLRQGEANADRVYIPLDKVYDGLDISEFAFELRAESEKDTLATQVLEKSVGDDEIRLLWVATSAFTAIAGSLKIVIVGLNTSGVDIIKITGENITVRETAGVKHLPAPNIVTEAINQVTLMVNRAVSAAVSAEKSAAAAAAMLQNANAYTDQQIKSANAYTNQQVKNTNIYIDQQVKSANAYTDQQVKKLGDNIYKMPYFDPIDGEKKDLQRVIDNMAAHWFGAYVWDQFEAKDLTWNQFEAKDLTWNQINDGGW